MAIKRRQGCYNPKREISAADALTDEQWQNLESNAVYGGNAEHKLHPADYGLGPPPNPRPGKTLCDGGGSFPPVRAVALLRDGCRKRLVSVQKRDIWPQNIWAVDADEIAFEAQLENRDTGAYHGYPMAADDPFRDVVLRAWSKK